MVKHATPRNKWSVCWRDTVSAGRRHTNGFELCPSSSRYIFILMLNSCIYIHILPYNYSPIVMAHPSKCVSYVVCKIWFNPPFLWKCLYQVRAIAVFPVFPLLNDFFCLLTNDFCLSLWKIARCSVILFLPLCRLSISQDMFQWSQPKPQIYCPISHW